MTEYIKRSDAIQAVTRAKLPDKTPDGIPIANGKRSVTDCVRRLKEIRSEDVVHVVRCKECQNGYEWANVDGDNYRYCGYLRDRWNHNYDRMVDDDDFCKWGRKMDGEA